MKNRLNVLFKKGTENGTLNQWEINFLQSILSQVEHRDLSVKQNNWLQKIEKKVNDSYDENWEKEWNEEKAFNLQIVADYYAHGGIYFQDIVQWIDENPTKIINKHNYKKLVENKYAQKIIKALSDPPRYQTGETVAIRRNANVPRGIRYSTTNKLLFVIKPLNKAISAVKGARVYLVLPAAGVVPFEIEERWLKKHRIKNKK